MFSFSFLSIILSELILKKGNIKYFRASGNVSTYRDHSVVFMSDVQVMQRGSIS